MQFTLKMRRKPSFNIIPLIDVLVVLLIFYIATTVFKRSQPHIPIHLAVSPYTTSAPDMPPSILSVTADDQIFLDGAPVEVEKLGDVLKSKVAADPQFKIAMKPDTKMTFGTLAKVMAAARYAGMGNLDTFVDAPKPEGN